MTDRPSGDPLLSAALDAHRLLADRASPMLREDELLQQFADVLRNTFPGCMVCVRLLDAARALSFVYATGRLRPEMRERLAWSGGVEPLPASMLPLESWGLVCTATYEPVFADGVVGFDQLLHDGDQLLGLLNLEWAALPGPGAQERVGVASLARHLGTVLHGARLHAEVVHLRERVAKLLDHADAPILVLDGRRRVGMFNRCLERLTGRSRAEVAGKDFLELIPEEERPRFQSVLASALRGSPTANCELRLPRASGGDPVQLSLNIAPVVGMGGEGVEEIIAIGQDLTELRRLQRQMIHTEKLATIGQLAAGVVHEINNPLTSVSIHADYLSKLMARENRGLQEITFINRIRDAAERILRFTQDLMNFARPTGDEPEQIELASVMDQSAAFCEHIIAKAGVTLERQYAAVPKVYGIRGQLQQVFINLFTNACHAMKGIEGERKLTLVVADHGDGRVRVEVRDTGTGIAAEIREEIFEPFFTTKVEGEGTGLGLSIVHNILDNHQAEIRVDSEVGKGSTFALLFYAA